MAQDAFSDSVGRRSLKTRSISKAWALTYHNYEQEHLELLRDLGSHHHVSYLVFQEEIAPETFSPHIQAAVVLHRNYRLAGLKKLTCPDFEWRPMLMNSTHEELVHYCLKPKPGCMCATCDNARAHPHLQHIPETFGDEPAFQQGKRNDLLELKKMVDEKKSFNDMYQAHFASMIRYSRGLKDYSIHIPVSVLEQYNPTVIYCWGPTTVGKSYQAKRYLYSKVGDSIWTKEDGAWWFDGYQGQAAVLLDDYRPEWFEAKLTRHLMLLRDLPRAVPTKGGFVKFSPKYIFITTDRPSNEHWACYGDYAQFNARITTYVDASAWPPYQAPIAQRVVTSMDQL
jgi:hypothetical protein